MAKKRKRRSSSGRPTQPSAPRAEERRVHKEEARRSRESLRRRIKRRSAFQRAATIGVVALAALGVFLFLTRAGAPKAIAAAALEAASAAGCGDVQTPLGSAPGGQHLSQGEPFTYDQHPATSGFHDPSPLPPEPHVYTAPVPETQAVHNLEHAYALIYYRADGPDALPADVVAALAALAEREDKVIMAPHPSLNAGTSLALTAWNKLWECPATVTAEEATAIASGFVEAYRGTSNAPEPQAG